MEGVANRWGHVRIFLNASSPLAHVETPPFNSNFSRGPYTLKHRRGYKRIQRRAKTIYYWINTSGNPEKRKGNDGCVRIEYLSTVPKIQSSRPIQMSRRYCEFDGFNCRVRILFACLYLSLFVSRFCSLTLLLSLFFSLSLLLFHSLSLFFLSPFFQS